VRAQVCCSAHPVVYLICLILCVCLSLFPPLCCFSSLSPWFCPGPVLSSPAQSSPPGGPLCHPVVSSLLVLGLGFSSPNHLTSPALPPLLSHPPQNKAQRECAAHSSIAHNSSCRLGISLPSSHFVFTFPSRINSAGSYLTRVHTGSWGKLLVAETVRVHPVRYLQLESLPFKLYIEYTLAPRPLRNLQEASSSLRLHRRGHDGFYCASTNLLQLDQLQLSRTYLLPLSTSYPFRPPHHHQHQQWQLYLQLR
jgi:hypothetical protein